MKQGKTNSGFEYVIKDEVLDDWELLEKLHDIDNGDVGLVVDVAKTLFDKDQLDGLKKHVAEVYGRVSITGMVTEIRDVLGGDEKN